MRDPEADRYELQAQRERDEALGKALFEHRRPNAPKAWEELSEADRTEWILIAVDQEAGPAVTSGTTAAVEAQVQAVDTELSHDPELQRGVRKLLGQMEALADSQDSAERHCLLVTDPQTSRQWVIGSFPNRLHARIAIPLIEARYRKADPDFVFTYTPMIFEQPPWENE